MAMLNYQRVALKNTPYMSVAPVPEMAIPVEKTVQVLSVSKKLPQLHIRSLIHHSK